MEYPKCRCCGGNLVMYAPKMGAICEDCVRSDMG